MLVNLIHLVVVIRWWCPDSNIEVTEEQGKMFKFEPGLTLDDLVRAVNEVGAAPSDLMAILQALKQAGAIEGQLIII